jgi:uncharacterized membrane protein (UPF0182 family)
MQIPPWIRNVFIALAVVWLGHRLAVDVLIDWLWFDAVGYDTVFRTTITAQAATWVGGFLVAAAALALNLRLATRRAPLNLMRLGIMMQQANLSPDRIRGMVRLVLVVAVGLPAFAIAGAVSAQWLDVLVLAHQQSFGTTDPVFGMDAGFYVFVLPVLTFARGLLVGLVGLAAIQAFAWYGFQAVSRSRERPEFAPQARGHLLVLGALLFLLVAAGWYLDRFGLLTGKQGVAWGVGAADEAARLPGYLIMVGASVGVSVTLAISTVRDGLRLPAFAAVFYVLARVLVAGVWPQVVQDYSIRPNELAKERPYIERAIEATRLGYGLERIEVRPFEAATGLTMADVEANPLTVDNIRVWDTRPLLTTYRQIQEIRTYYEFNDVDVDRYTLNGVPRQVMLTARELDYARLPSEGRSWVNQRLQYTHGYGLTMSPVNVVTTDGLPELFIQDIPPASTIDLEVTRPEVYYGESTDQYVIVKTSAQEFDYPMGDQNVYTRYEGKGGVPIGTLPKKVLFALWFGELDVLLSNYIEPDSRVMLRRDIRTRVEALAPFLEYDADPYLVVEDGRMRWVLDAYTVTDRFPYSEPFDSRPGRKSFNYIRNSVKVVIDAYDGTVDFYISDPDDPIVQAYASVFAGTFRSMDELPASLDAHLRYPSDFFDIQARMYRTYHMSDPTVFYNREDLWEIPRELYGGDDQKMESYYLIMKLPEEERAEFILLVPFVPSGKPNMIAWMAARCDPEHYGDLVLYQFPKQKLIYGPRQIEARIDQDPDISEMMTLWGQGGSEVRRGNLLVIPIADSLLYVEPLYLQAASSELPELKRIIVSYENRIAMETSLEKALAKVFAPAGLPEAPKARADGEPTPEARAPVAEGSGWQLLAVRAGEAWSAAEAARVAGDWAAYGAALEELEAAVQALEAAAGSPADDAAEVAAPEAPPAPAPEAPAAP